MNKICTTSIPTPRITHLLEDTVFYISWRYLNYGLFKNKYALSFI